MLGQIRRMTCFLVPPVHQDLLMPALYIYRLSDDGFLRARDQERLRRAVV
jgi:hypothetical protein